MKKLVVLFALSIVSQYSFAKTICVCQTGDTPADQVKFFKAGCKIWLMAKTCDDSTVVSETENLDKILTSDYQGGNLELGFVGHWSGSRETVTFLRDKIVPVIEKKDIDATIDNTACLGMNNAFSVQQYLNTLKAKGFKNKINYKGNQVESFGIWDKLVLGSFNLFATASTEFDLPNYPICKKFAYQMCSGLVQDKEEGLCVNESHELERLICRENKRMIATPGPRAANSQTMRTRNEWVPESKNFEKYNIDAYNISNQKTDINDPSASTLTITNSIIINKSLPIKDKLQALDLVKTLNQIIVEKEINIKNWNDQKKQL